VDGLWATKSEGVELIVRAVSFQDFQPMWCHRQTDRQTDRRTTCNLNTALCTSASRGKKCFGVSQLSLGLPYLGHRTAHLAIMIVFT